jgi:hypothetical protein
MATTFVVLWSCTLLCGQQIAFTSRVHLQSPVVITSIQESRTYGFDSVMLHADSGGPVRAVRFRVTFKTRAGEEITDDRRVVVDMESRDHKNVIVDLGHIEGLKQLAKSRQQESGLAVITVSAVEFQDGTVWEDSGAVEGIPVVPINVPKK